MVDDDAWRGRPAVEVNWVSTSPMTGRFDPVETSSDLLTFQRTLEALRARGLGYVEVRRVDPYPVVTLAFNRSAAVIQAFASPDTVLLLTGDGSAPGHVLELPVLDDMVSFDHKAGLALEPALRLVLDFAEGRELDDLGTWNPL